MPSQLKRLRESLKNAGVIGQPQQSKKAKKKARQNRSGNDARLSREAALESIREEFNPFEIKKNKEKFAVAGGRKVKGTEGRPGISKSIGEETRRKTLLVEMQNRNKVGGIIDRRFGENDPSIAPEDKMLERFTREQQQRAHKSDIFNLEDDDEVLTHYGQSLGSLPTDDFGEVLGDDGSDDDLLRPAKRGHPLDGERGGEEDSNDEDGPPRKKSKAEVMKEVIAKSKFHKFERQKEKEADEDLRDELDAELGDIRALLAGIPAKPKPLKPATNGATDGMHAERAAQLNVGLDIDKEYDKSVREMTYDKRSKPADRTKTAEEQAEDRAKQLQKLEKSRQKRMRGEESDEEEEEDDQEEGSDNEFGLGKGIKLAPEDRELFHGATDSEISGSDEEEEEEEEEEDGSDSEDESDAEGNDILPAEVGVNGARRRDLDNDDAYSDDYQSDEDADALVSNHGETESEGESEEDDLVASDSEATPKTNGASNGTAAVGGALPYTFPCPQTHKEFVKVVEPFKTEDLPTIVKRIRVLHHPSLHQDNKGKLSNFMVVIFDHIIYLSDQQSPPPMEVIEILIRHLHSLSKEFPQQSATRFREHLQKLFDRIGQQKKTKRSDLIILTALGVVFPTSDHFHLAVTPAMLVISRWLSSSVPSDLLAMAHGCYLVTLALQYQRLSKRIIPEVLNYVYQCLIALSPASFAKLPGVFPLHGVDKASKFAISSSSKEKTEIGKLKFKKILYPSSSKGEDDGITKSALALTFVRLIESFAKLYASKTAFIETFAPAEAILKHYVSPSCIKHLPKQLSLYIKDTALPELQRQLTHAQKFRRPLELHHHRPLPIPSHLPKFEEEYSLDRHKSSYDPDRERKELSKLKAEHKKERKGAMRELRKDSAFVAREKLKERKIADQEYHDKMKKIVDMIQNEEGAATNAYEKEKASRRKKGSK